ncbi:hypothetical protein [Erwinia sp. S59]|uniref:hypothetical protein n=1 Tax=Erwinia sp. S59 TaxID=2769340 RepID=UPI0019091E8B|nr:hypothetical protein [Erwinia sp. S59]MBK0092797.1 hypothetical protein [Erwinia sp. S59]
MNGYKEFLDGLQKMTDVRLNIAILIVCSVLIYFSPSDKFILDPLPKIIPQSLILVTTIRLIFSIINLAHAILNRKLEERKERKASAEASLTEAEENKSLDEKLKNDLINLDAFQLFIVNQLIGKNNSSHKKGASLFSLISSKIVYVVATGDHSQSVALTIRANRIIKETYGGDLSSLEVASAARAFDSFTPKELSFFKKFLEKDTIKSTWQGHDKRTYYIDGHKLFTAFRESILFERSQIIVEFTLNPVVKPALLIALEKSGLLYD